MHLNPQRYDIDLKYKVGKESIIADALSKAQLKENEEKIQKNLKHKYI